MLQSFSDFLHANLLQQASLADLSSASAFNSNNMKGPKDVSFPWHLETMAGWRAWSALCIQAFNEHHTQACINSISAA